MFNQIAPSRRITYLVAQRISLVAFVAKCKKWANAPKLGESNNLFTLTKIHKCNFKIKGSEYFWNNIEKARNLEKRIWLLAYRYFPVLLLTSEMQGSLINFLSCLSESLTIPWFCTWLYLMATTMWIDSINQFVTVFIYYIFIYLFITDSLHYITSK